MDRKLLRLSQYLCIITFIFLVFWIVLVIISYSDIGPNWENIDFIKWVANPNIFFYIELCQCHCFHYTQYYHFYMLVCVFEKRSSDISLRRFGFHSNLWIIKYHCLFIASDNITKYCPVLSCEFRKFFIGIFCSSVYSCS